MGNSSSRIGEPSRFIGKVHSFDTIYICHYSISPKGTHHTYGDTDPIHYRSEFGNSHMPITGPFIMTTPQKQVFHDLGNDEIFKFYDPKMVKRLVEINNAAAYPVGYYWFIPQRHTVQVFNHPANISTLLTGLSENAAIPTDTTTELISIAVPHTIQDNYYVEHPQMQWHMDPFQTAHVFNRQIYPGTYPNADNFFRMNSLPLFSDRDFHVTAVDKMFPVKLPVKRSSTPSLTGLINVQTTKISALGSTNFMSKSHHKSISPYHVACITLYLDDLFPTESIETMTEFANEMSEAIRGGQLLDWYDFTIHIFLNSTARVDQVDQVLLTPEVIAAPLKNIVPADQINIHYLEKPGDINTETSSGMSYTWKETPSTEQVSKIVWPEIIKAFLKIQSQKTTYKQLSTQLGTKPWLPYQLYSPSNHIEQISRSLLDESTKEESTSTGLLNMADFFYHPSTVARALASVSPTALTIKHRDPAVVKAFEKIVKMNHKAMLKCKNGPNELVMQGLPNSSQPFAILNGYKPFEYSYDHGPCLFQGKKVPVLISNDVVSDQNGKDPNDQDAGRVELNAYPPLPVPQSETKGTALHSQDLGEEGQNNDQKDHKSTDSSSMIIETSFQFRAFISNRYLLALQKQSTEMKFQEDHPRLKYGSRIDEISHYDPMVHLSHLHITDMVKEDWKVNPHFITEVHTLFPNVDTQIKTVDYNLTHLNCPVPNFAPKPKPSLRSALAHALAGDEIPDEVQDEIPNLGNWYNEQQLQLINNLSATPIKSTIEYLYRNDNTLYTPHSLRKFKGTLDFTNSRGISARNYHMEECSGKNHPSLYSRPLCYLFGTHLFEYNINFASMTHQRNPKTTILTQDANQTNSTTPFPPAFDGIKGQFRIPTLFPYFPFESSKYLDENECEHVRVPREWELFQKGKDSPPPFEPYKIMSIVSEEDEAHCNGNLLCPMHVVFVVRHTDGDQTDRSMTQSILANQLQEAGVTKTLPNNCNGLYDALKTIYPKDSAEFKAIQQYRHEVNVSCREQLKQLFSYQLVPSQRIDELWHFHIIPHDHLEPLMVQIQSNAVLNRLKLYAAAVDPHDNSNDDEAQNFINQQIDTNFN